LARDATLGAPNLLNWKGVWVAGTYALGESVFYDGAYYISDANGNTAEPPAGDWRVIDFVLSYPGAGVPVSTGSAWATSKAAPTGDLVGTTDTQTLTGKTIAFGSNTLTDVVSVSATQTLTGKTIAFDSNTLTDVVSTNTAQTITAKTLGNYTETVFAITDGATVNLDPNNGPIQTWTLGANRTPGQANWSAGQSITLLVNDGSARTITWTTLAVVWKTNNGGAPPLQTSGFTVIVLWKVGTTIYGARVGDA
jgi:hypothetical protein